MRPLRAGPRRSHRRGPPGNCPPTLNDRAGDIWEPLLTLADLAGGPWPELARQAAAHLTANAQENSPITALLCSILRCNSSIPGPTGFSAGYVGPN